ncbi:hypothetical protein ZYGR_0AD02110 [Zygosaccharomyces rouxii]|uniref:ZYRO0G10868p n=2 Tax=Zygosaccharomyces rouxii TaxID=4956 RepID=C5E095_ZYGRC|nr:uncharacterized protein ZYRO0G10868g [Zygosaccharomyces rouxii]KAH9202523.1 actin interacting protein 3-domain-containing protein [Zygosaccharomyces rouxii]GAV51028.1 hypothetical protein ZYGR_0AD02110 [Zygosaccharomyces rouxii]CAR29529.1 ZYRO0G10868p [Zygosaccharomyces rouxii]
MLSSGREGLEYPNGRHSSNSSRKSSSSTLSNSSVETTVTKLLMSTKQLLQTLTQWSKGIVNERMVSDAYVQLGNDFKLVSKFFSHSGLEVSDLGDVPMDLRRVLEVALRDEPSDETLNKYLPSIREIIVTLLDKLKVKQALLKSMKSEKGTKRSLHQQRPSTVSSLSLSNKSTPPSSRTPSVSFTPKTHGQEISEPRTHRKNDIMSPEIAKNASLASPVNSSSSNVPDAATHMAAPKQQNLSETEALSELKKGNNLQRRASKRFSAYQMAKLTNHSNTEAAAAGALASVPPSLANTVTPSLPASSPASLAPPLPRDLMAQTLESPVDKEAPSSQRGTGNNYDNDYDKELNHQTTAKSTTNKSPVPPDVSPVPVFQPRLHADTSGASFTSAKTDHINEKQDEDPSGPLYTIFLRMNGKTKKCHLPPPTSMHELQLLFVEKFAYSFDEDSFPDLYLQDPKFSVFYELDQQGLSDLHDGCIVELKVKDKKEDEGKTGNKDVEMEKEPKINFAEVISSLRGEISRAQEDMLDQMRDLSMKTQESLKTHELSLASRNMDKSVLSGNVPTSTSTPAPAFTRPAVPVETVSALKQELSVLRQLHNESKRKSESTIGTVLSKLENFKNLSLEADKSSSNNRYIETSQNRLSELSDALLSKVDDLQDVIEVLRKDVAVHGVKPSKKKLDSVQKELVLAENDLSMMQMFMQNEKPQWKKIWKAELEKVCEEQQFLTLQEDLTADLKEDLGKALETFDLVNMCCVEQERHPKKSRSNPILPIPEPGTFHRVRDQVLNEVQALNPDHNERIEALERAQKMWEREREYRDTDAFEDELGNFVEKGNLKTAGGVEEVERIRKQKDENNLRAYFGGLDL